MATSCKYDSYTVGAGGFRPLSPERVTKGSAMQISSRFTIALHTLMCIWYFGGEYKVTSSFIASSVGVNPVIIRKTLGQLKEAGIVSVEAGVGGASLAKDPADITLLDVFRSVECVDGALFSFHEHPNMQCPVGRLVHPILDGELAAAQRAMEERLESRTLADLVAELGKAADKAGAGRA